MTDRPMTDPKWWTDLGAEGERYQKPLYEHGMDAQRYKAMCEQQDAEEMARALERIDHMSRNELRRLLDQDPSKTNTDKLRRKARLRWIEGSIDHIDLHYATRTL